MPKVQYYVTVDVPEDLDLHRLDRDLASVLYWEENSFPKFDIERISEAGEHEFVAEKTDDDIILAVPCMGCGKPITTSVSHDWKPYIWHEECFKERG